MTELPFLMPEKKIFLKPQKRKVGYLFQNYALFPNMTVEQNIGIGFTGNKEDKQKMVEQLIHHFQLDGLEKLYPSKLSGGQQQRTALARIMAYEPDVIFWMNHFRHWMRIFVSGC